MSGELFPIESVAMDSPRLAWLKRHRICTSENLVSDPTLNFSAWIQDQPYEVSYGETEDEALMRLAVTYGISMWNEEGA